MSNKTLILLRGLPGSGKTTFGLSIDAFTASADDYFDIYHKGKFKPHKIGAAHGWCRDLIEARMQSGWTLITVANTFTQEWEMKPYIDMAEGYGYNVHSLIVENRHGSSSVHDVPEETIERMRHRFEVEL
jgi:predicted kinase